MTGLVELTHEHQCDDVPGDNKEDVNTQKSAMDERSRVVGKHQKYRYRTQALFN